MEKVGVDPQIQRIGKYKSAGDQLTRKTMSEENREMLTAILDNIYGNWLDVVASSRGDNDMSLISLVIASFHKIRLKYDYAKQERQDVSLRISLTREFTRWKDSKKRVG